uniref:phosphonate C-P lyase system protein PhnG n=1 Tax=Mangrovicoccus ximenensis TaxID=1911570 RepID=UPI000D375BA3
MQSANAERQAWMGLLAKAPPGRAAGLLDAAMARPAFAWLRAPETGSVMVVSTVPEP